MRSVIDELKRIDLSRHIGGNQEKAGKAIRVNPCPLCGHNDAFTIYVDTNSYKCFSCGKSGSIIDYTMDSGAAGDVKGAIEKLAGQYNIKLEQPDRDKLAGGVSLAEIATVFELAVQHYKKMLAANKPAMEYLTKVRGRSMEVIEGENYGFAPTRKSLTSFLSTQRVPLKVQIASGLVLPGKEGKPEYDLFGNGQIIYPGYVSGKVCDFTAKPLDKTKGNVCRLRNENRLRSCNFYGQDALYNSEVILVEGQEDRNSILELGNYHVAAILGSLSEEQIKMLAERCEGKKVYLCFDKDEAGEKYTQKLSKALPSSLVYICEFEDAKDIDEWLRTRDKQELDILLRKATDPISWHLARIAEDLPPREFKLALQPTIELIAAEPDELMRAQYLVMAEEQLKAKPKIMSALNRTVKAVLKQADLPMGGEDGFERSVARKGTIYIKITKDSYRAISGFVLDITRYIEDDDILYYEVVLHTYAGASRAIILSNEQRINTKLFDAALSAVGPYYFYGSLCDLKEIWQLEEERAKIKSYTCRFNRYGYIKKHKIWLFANCAYKAGKMYLPEEGQDVIVIDNIGYQSKNVRIYGGDQPSLEIVDKPRPDYIPEVIRLFNEMWDSDKHNKITGFKGFMAIGFVAATVYMHELTMKENKFPYILAFGPPGTGKSEAMQFVMNMFGFRSGGENWGEATSAGISMAMEQLSSIPYWLEEFSNSMGASVRQQNKIEILKNIYNRSSGGKGGLTGRTIYEVNATLFLTGQDRPENQAFLSRCIVLRKEPPSEMGTRAYYHLKAEGKKLSLVLRWLLETKSEARVELFMSNLGQLMEALKSRIRAKGGDYNERTAINYAIIATGFSMFEYHERDNEFLDWLVDECLNDMNRKQAEDIVFRFFTDIETIFNDQMSMVLSRSHSELYLNFNLIYNEWVKNMRATGMQEYIGREGLLDYLKKDPHEYWLPGSHRKYFKFQGVQKQVRCIGILIDKLPTDIREIVTGWDIQLEAF